MDVKLSSEMTRIFMPLIFVIIHHSLMNALTANYFSFFQQKKQIPFLFFSLSHFF